jgi:hypothetical protein
MMMVAVVVFVVVTLPRLLVMVAVMRTMERMLWYPGVKIEI